MSNYDFDKGKAPTEGQVHKYEYLSPMLDSALNEMREFAKKKQDGIVSSTKVKIINRLLSEIREVLEREESLKYLDLLVEEELPQNSDAVIILGQYKAALKSFEEHHHRYWEGSRTWVTQEIITDYEAEMGSLDNMEDDEDDN